MEPFLPVAQTAPLQCRALAVLGRVHYARFPPLTEAQLEPHPVRASFHEALPARPRPGEPKERARLVQKRQL